MIRLALLLLTLLLATSVETDAMIIFENPEAANMSSNGTLSYTDPYRARVDHLIQRALEEFSLRLEAAVSSQTPGQNTVFSPLSIASVLALVLLGARGVTHAEVARLLGVTAGINLTGKSHAVHEELGRLLDMLEERKEKDGTHLSIAKGLFLQHNFHINQSFVNYTREIYHSEVRELDFQQSPREALKIINKWVENRTEGHIRDLLTQEPDLQTKAVIASALYFIGQWENPFYPGATKVKPFYVGKEGGKNYNEIIDVDLMVNGAEIPYYADPVHRCTIIGMPYKGNKITMYVIVPDTDIKSFLDTTSASDIEHLIKKTEKRPVIFFFPRMRLESTINLVPPLKKMGLKSLFDIHTANLTNIADGIFVNEAVHKVEIDITEDGTVASAATAFSFTRDGSNPVVRVEKPFIFFIRHDETGVTLFWGTVIKPTPHYKHTP
uniref:Serpin domain-containing protein n=1 Tax=Cuerna arida TaxID=1464854 RepID=A0A1B6GCU3_9HEMI